MSPSIPRFRASEAARRLGVSAKALRLYEARGLLVPGRTAAGYRSYGPNEMARAAEIAGLRALGLGLAEIARVLEGDPASLESALAAHESALDGEIRRLVETLGRVRALRSRLAQGQAPDAAEVSRVLARGDGLRVAFDLPWPWGGERFEYADIRPLTYIVGPLGSGKTRFAQRIAEALPGGVFLGLDRVDDTAAAGRRAADPALAARVARTLACLVDDGAVSSDALTALVTAVERREPAALVIDMVEQGLDGATQAALIVHLRRHVTPGMGTLFLMTRSSVILDLTAVGPDEAIILCPANHSPPVRVAPCPGAPGYEAVATCLALPEVRARTAGTIAWRPDAA